MKLTNKSFIIYSEKNNPRLIEWDNAVNEVWTNFQKEYKRQSDVQGTIPSIIQKYITPIKELQKSFTLITGEKFWIKQYNKNKVETIFNIKHYIGSHKIIRQDWDSITVKNMTDMQIYFILSKYGHIHFQQIPLMFISTALVYFKCYGSDALNNFYWNFTIEDVNKYVYNFVKSDFTEYFNAVNKKISANTPITVEFSGGENEEMDSYLKTPKKAEHITCLWENSEWELSQPEKIKLVMEYWGMTRPTAVKYMKKFGLYKTMEEKYGENHETVQSSNLGKRPLQAEHLTDLWKDEPQLKQSAKVALIMDHYDCERTTAVRWMKQFNLWVRPVAEKNSMKEQSEPLTDSQNEAEIWKAKYLDMEAKYLGMEARITSLESENKRLESLLGEKAQSTKKTDWSEFDFLDKY